MLKGKDRIKKAILAQKSKGEVPLIPYITAFDPDKETTKRILFEMAEVEPCCVELGFPFSDPVADGPTIQKAMVRALKNAPSLDEYFELVAEVRSQGFQIPILLMTYYNILYRYGLKRVVEKALSSGVDGFIVPDLPLEEIAPFKKELKGSSLALVLLCAPTTPEERIKRISKATSGFLYYVSLTGITGARDRLPEDIRQRLTLVKKLSSQPVAVGFGISKPEHVQLLSPYADALVVGSALVRLIEEDAKSSPRAIKNFLRTLKGSQ